jgi:ABC-type sulfate/molybdate transport systems ATPase subunit
MHSESTLDAELYVPGARPDRPRLDLRLNVGPRVTLLWGPSGAGKSTCLLALAGLVAPSTGYIELAGCTLFDARRRICVPPRARGVGLVFQSLALFPHLDVLRNVMYGISAPHTRHEREREARRWLRRMHVEHLETRNTATLSGGEAQRVALARAFAPAPRLLLLDEPFSALDRGLRRELTLELSHVVDELRVPTLLVSHHDDDLQRWPNDVVRVSPPRATPCPFSNEPLSQSLQAR